MWQMYAVCLVSPSTSMIGLKLMRVGRKHIYRLIDADVFYVGHTDNMERRLHQHINHPERHAGKALAARIKTMRDSGRVPHMELIETIYYPEHLDQRPYAHLRHITEKREQFWIAFYR